MYGGLFLVSGMALLAFTYVLVSHDIEGKTITVTKSGVAMVTGARSGGIGVSYVNVPASEATAVKVNSIHALAPPTSGSPGVTIRVPVPGIEVGKAATSKEAGEQLTILMSEAHTQQETDLHQLLLDSGIALLIMAVLSVLLGWLVAGRALGPLRVITSKAQDISSTNLHERIGLRGPDDEMKRLGDTFDDLLARLERSFDAQRQFVSNASHELRTPLARQRTLLEVASGDPGADVVSLREASMKAISAGEDQEQLIEALLTLASSERGLDHRVPFDLAEVVRHVVESKRPEATLRRLDVATELAPARTSGDPRLAERLVVNLVENAIRYNEPSGRMVVTTDVVDGEAVLRVANTGPTVPETEIERLFEPFQRLEPDRVSHEGHGLGLSIVRAVAVAHTATVTATSRPTGGLDVRVAFPLDETVDETVDDRRPNDHLPGEGSAGGAARASDHVPRAVDGDAPATGD